MKRDMDTDVMRILASLGVIVIHMSNEETFSGIFLGGLARFSVPVFVMISGYYMLSRKPAGRKLACKCGRLLALMLAWSGIYYGYDLACGVRTFAGIGGLLTYLFTEPVHLWYIYAIIALYIFTPLLYVFVEHADRTEYRYALALTFFFGSPVEILLRSGCAPVLGVILTKMKAPHLLGMVFMYLLGGYFRRYGVDRPVLRYAVYLLGVLGSAVTVAGTVWLAGSSRLESLFLSFFAPNVIVQGAMVFVFCKYFPRRFPHRPEWLRGAVGFLAKETLGVYLAHPLVIRLLRFVPMPASTGLSIVLRTLLVFIVTSAAVSVLRCVPLLRRMVE